MQQGIDALAANPWDAPTLTQMATACGAIFKEEGLADKGNFGTYGDCELYYLKCAHDTFPRGKPDIDVRIQLAEALKNRGRYLEAISFWHMVEVVRPDDDLPKREIATLTVLLHQSRDTKFDDGTKKTMSSNTSGKTEEVSHEDRLAQRIKRNPNDIAAYDELSGLYMNADNFAKALEVLNQKLAVTNNDVQVEEAIEDVHLKASARDTSPPTERQRNRARRPMPRRFRRSGRSSSKRNCKPIATAVPDTRTTSPSASSWAAATSSTATSRMQSGSFRSPRPIRGSGASACCIWAIASTPSSNMPWR